MEFINKAREYKNYMVGLRRDLHRIPETGTHLPKTTVYVATELKRLGITYEAKEYISCIFAQIGSGKEDEPCILLRADMDGLPITEASGESFSCTTGTMHGCGHDMHAAALLGAARLLKEQEKELYGTVKFIFQSGEETFEGARAAVDAGILRDPKPDVAYGSHVFAKMPLNSISYGQVPMGAVYGFKITIHGVGGHGSLPELCVDPINAAVQVYLALQSLLARECPATKEAVLTIGQLKAGEAANVIPEQAVLQGTLRTFDGELRAYLIRRIGEVTQAVSAAYRCSADLEVISDCPSVVCDPEFSDFCMKTLREKNISSDIHTDMHVMGSEDFAHYTDQIPGCYFCIGSEPEDKAHALGQHNPAIRFNEESLVTAAAAHAQIAFDYLESRKAK